MKTALPVRPASTPPSVAGSQLQVRGLTKIFDGRSVLRDLDLRIGAGEFTAIVGRSGCGKSTLLRLIAGLEHAEAGIIRIDDQPAGSSSHASTRVMFQDPRLLPWKRVLANVALGRRRENRHAAELLAAVGLADRAHEWPGILSGGQRQRVALARALVTHPRLLLLDEPLGALDALTRLDMQGLIERLWLEQGFTAVLITHDVEEAIALADRVVLLEEGRISFDRAVGLDRPRDRGTAAFARLRAEILDRVMGRQPGAPLHAGETYLHDDSRSLRRPPASA